jgi:hypothetical protein
MDAGQCWVLTNVHRKEMSMVGVRRTRNALTETRVRSAFAQPICHAQLQSPPRLSPARFCKSPRTSRILNRKFNITGIYPEQIVVEIVTDIIVHMKTLEQ